MIARAVPWRRLLLACLACLSVSCDRLPGKPAPPAATPGLDVSTGFRAFYAERCAGCHGDEGRYGPARPLNAGIYLASIPEDALFTIVRDGIPGTRMPGFGGSSVTGVSDEQIRAFILGMKRTWANPTGLQSIVPWQAGLSEASAEHGATLFASRCEFCHPRAGNQTQVAGAQQGAVPRLGGDVRDPFYARLVSDQHLRTSIIFGRDDLHMPSVRGPFFTANGERVVEELSVGEVDALVAYLASFRQASTLSGRFEGGTP